MMKAEPIRLARVGLGAESFEEGNISDTYRGQIVLPNGSTAIAVIKDLPLKELVNELIGAVLADRVGLPFPDAFLAIADPAVLATSKGPLTPEGDRLMFATVDVKLPSIRMRYIADPSSAAGLFAGITVWPELGRLYGFDTWIANVDRNAGNLLFGSGGEVWLIDHGQCLTGPDWVAADLDPEGDYINRLAEWLTRAISPAGRKMRCEQAARLQLELPALDLLEIMAVSYADQILSAADQAAVVRFLSERIMKVAYYANAALDVRTIV